MVEPPNIPTAFPAGYQNISTYEARGTPTVLYELRLFVASSDSTKDGYWVATALVDEDSWVRFSSIAILADDIVTAMIKDLAITSAKIALDAINGTLIADNAVDTEHLVDDAVGADELADTAVSAGSYTSTDLTVDAQGRITAASSGGGSGARILKMWLAGSSNNPLTNSNVDVDWSLNFLINTNFWAVANPERILIPDVTKDIIIEHFWLVDNKGLGDDNFNVNFQRFNSSDSFQDEITYSRFIKLNMGEKSLRFETALYEAGVFSAGDYLVMQVSNDNSEAELSDQDSVVKIYEVPEVT